MHIDINAHDRFSWVYIWNSDNVAGFTGTMLVAEEAGVRMMKEYFDVEASKSTPW